MGLRTQPPRDEGHIRPSSFAPPQPSPTRRFFRIRAFGVEGRTPGCWNIIGDDIAIAGAMIIHNAPRAT
jgi:hypothetical protein